MVDQFIIGYSDRFSVRPGEDIHIMVSTSEPEYQVDLVRISRGDDDVANGLKETLVDRVASRKVRGRVQQVQTGSCVEVSGIGKHLEDLDSWTIRLWFCPTIVGGRQSQVLIDTVSPGTNIGWSLFIDRESMLTLNVAGSVGASKVACPGPLLAGKWYEVVAGQDRDSGTTELLVRQLPSAEVRASRSRTNTGHLRGLNSQLTIGAQQCVPPLRGFESHYNGRIEDVVIYSLPPSAILDEGKVDFEHVVASWLFGDDMASDVVRDIGPHGRDGKVMNSPTRAVTGYRWNGEFLNHKESPDHYGAIHFHEDDLGSAGWSPDFSIHIPEDLRSGLYAVRCATGAIVDRIPFAVLPAGSTGTARAVLVLPLYTYLAYANTQAALDDDFMESGLISREPIRTRDQELIGEHPEWGRSLYDKHSDGTGIIYSSLHRPIVDLRPDHLNWVTGGPRGLSADLCLVYWLERNDFDVDVITDHELDRDGIDAISSYKTVLTGSHPEYYTGAMRGALDEYVDIGGNLMYLGGNGFYWVTSTHPANPNMIEVRRGMSGTRPWTSAPGEVYHSTTGEPGGLWRHRGLGPNDLVGVGFAAQGWDSRAGYYRRSPASYEPEYDWIFAGVDGEVIGDFGLVMDGAAGDEIDRYDATLGGEDAVVLATSEGHSSSYCVALEDLHEVSPSAVRTDARRVRSDIVYYRKGRGTVFSVGSMCWVPALPINGCKNNVSSVTKNVLLKFIEEAN